MKYIMCDVIDNDNEDNIKFRTMLTIAASMLESYCPSLTVNVQAEYLRKKTREKMKEKKIKRTTVHLRLRVEDYKIVTKSDVKCYMIKPLGFDLHINVNTPRLKDYDIKS